MNVSAVSLLSAQAPPRPGQDLQREIETLESMRDIFTATGNRGKADEMSKAIAKKKALISKASQPPRELTSEQVAAVVARLQDGTPPGADFPDDLRAPLDSFARLHARGVEFSTASFDAMQPQDAFCQLARYAYHGREQQVMWKTYRDGNIQLSTLRPEYLKGLAFYLEETSNGHLFYEKTALGHDPIRDPQHFLKVYQDAPESALVKAADGTFAALAEARQRDLDWARRVANVDEQGTPIQETPQVQDLGETVSIGGIVVRKRKP